MRNKIFGLAVIFIFMSTIGVNAGAAANKDTPAPGEEAAEINLTLRLPDSSTVQKVALFSEKYAQVPVATVNGEPITVRELADQLITMHGEMDQAGSQKKKDFASLLDRLIAMKLVVQESANIGFDKTPDVRRQLDNFALKTMIIQLISKQLQNLPPPDADKVEELYGKMALEAKLATYTFINQAEAQALLDQYRAGGDFEALSNKAVESKQAVKEDASSYVKLNDLLPAVAQAVFEMEIGGVSDIFKVEKGSLLFKLEDRRVYEDAKARQQAVQMIQQQQVTQRQKTYIDELVDKYVTMHPEAEAKLDFEEIVQENPAAKASELFAQLRNDQQPLATIKNNEQFSVVTVADVIKDLEASFYHGTDNTIIPKETEVKINSIIEEKLLKIVGKMEAQSLKIDQSPEYLAAVKEFRNKTLFETFMSKAVLPDVKVSQAEARDYYNKHIDDYSSPLMLKLKSLAFTDEKNALEAMKKLQAGSDFKWVSANVAGLASGDDKTILNFGGSLLTITALPAELQKTMANARQGDVYFYRDPGNLFYVLVIESAFPPQAKPYEEVQNEAAKIVYGRKIKEALDEYVGKLKEAYDTEVFLVQENL